MVVTYRQPSLSVSLSLLQQIRQLVLFDVR